jgi:hypothetical protein
MAHGLRLPALQLDLAGTLYEDSAVTWTEVTPVGTDVKVYTAIDGESFTQVAASGNPIAGLSLNDPLAGVYATIKVVLSTIDTSVTPSFSGLEVQVEAVQAALSGATGVYDQGRVKWTTGSNAGLAMEVKRWDASTRELVLFLPMPFDIVAGDEFEILPGCDKQITTCKDPFDNVINFRGEPHVPGKDHLMRYPDRPGD